MTEKTITEEKESKTLLESSIKLGDITLASARLDLPELCKYVVWLLQQKEILNYLGVFELKKLKTNGDYYG